MQGRATPALLILAVAGFLLASACTATGRYKVLSFFFEGVTPPGGGEATSTESSTEQEVADPLGLLGAVTRTDVFWHSPFFERECARCHSMSQGGEVRDVPGGLCRSCHAGLLADKPFVHGPAAVEGCLECHHPHKSEIPGILLREGESLCTRCHEVDDLLPGEHHETVGAEIRACTKCHDPHGGVDRLFLRALGARD